MTDRRQKKSEPKIGESESSQPARSKSKKQLKIIYRVLTDELKKYPSGFTSYMLSRETKGWQVWQRYKTERDRDNALIALEHKRRTQMYYRVHEFKAGDQDD